MTPEGKTKEMLKRFFKKHNIPYFMIMPSPMGNTVGMSDFNCILPDGKWLAVEAKSADKKSNVSPHQRKFLDTITTNNGLAYVVSCQLDLDVLESELIALGYIEFG